MMKIPCQIITKAATYIRCLLIVIWLTIDHWISVRDLNQRRFEVCIDERPIEGNVVIVTGSNSGIGKRISLELARRGAKIIMACRNQLQAEKARQGILKVIPSADVEVLSIEMSDINSIKTFVAEFKLRHSHLDVLVNNAGMMTPDLAFTHLGFEKHIGVNYLGSFLLTLLLLDSLKKATCARVVFLSSSAISLANFNVNNIMMKGQQLGLLTPYSNSKLCIAIFSRQLASLLSGTRVSTYAVCPGLVRTNILRYQKGIFFDFLIDFFYKIGSVSIEQGCATVLHCILSKSIEKESGKFYRYLKIWEPADRIISKYNGTELWQVSEKLVGFQNFE